MPCGKTGCRIPPGPNKPFCNIHKPDSEFPECSICLAPVKRTKEQLDCGHVFHARCIMKWSERSGRCPMCREPFMTEEEPWENVLHETIRNQLARAVADLRNGQNRVDIAISIEIPLTDNQQ